MSKMNIILLLLSLLYSSSCFGQEKMRVDIDSPTVKSAPKTTSGTGMSGDNTRRNLIWRVDLAPLTSSSSGSLGLEIHVVNVSAVPRLVPVSQDGAKLTAECPDHTVLEGVIFLGGKPNADYFLNVGRFFGCEAFPVTVVQLKPGEWVSYVTEVHADRLPKEIRAQIRLVNTKYRQGPNGQTSEDLEYDTYEFSPWVAVPQASGTNK